jgi:hypothetical protein
VTSPDLPQFDPQNLTGGWTEVDNAYALSPFLFSIPVAIQTITNSNRRTLCTGLLVGTEDRYVENPPGEEVLLTSVFYFKDTPMLTIDWRDVKGVLVMVATEFPKEGDNAPE